MALDTSCDTPLQLPVRVGQESVLPPEQILEGLGGTWGKEAVREKWERERHHLGSGVVLEVEKQLFLKQPDWFALRDLTCNLCLCRYQTGTGGAVGAVGYLTCVAGTAYTIL